MGEVLEIVLMTGMALLAIFLILLILVQRGRGGGLAGALGGMGGQSAFGTKAGDLFTRITIAIATIWILVCMLSVKQLRQSDSLLTGAPDTPPPASGGAQPGSGSGATGTTGSGATGESVPAGENKPSSDGGTATPEKTGSSEEDK